MILCNEAKLEAGLLQGHYTSAGSFLRFCFGDRKEILRDRLEEFERPFSIDVISGHYILRDRLGPSKHL